MTKTLLLAAAASLALSACAQTQPYPPGAVFLSQPGNYVYSGPHGSRTVVIRDRQAPRSERYAYSDARTSGAGVVVRRGRGPLFVNGRYIHGGSGAEWTAADPEMAARLTRDAERRAAEARLRGEEARRRGEEAGRRAEEAVRRSAEARLRGDEARRRGEEARRRGDEARVRGDEVRAMAERLRQQCERGEIRCTVVDNGVVIVR